MNEPPKRRMVRAPIAGVVRAEAVRLKSGKTRSASSRAWLERQISDPFAAEARAKGYRSRAAFKIAEIDDRFRLIRRGVRVIDLGCAPGGWLQVALERGAGQVVGVDLLAIAPIPPAEILLGDFTGEGMAERLIAALSGAPDLVLSDMAPNTTGHQRTDHLRIVALLEAAADFAIATLKPGGAFLAKAFQGGETGALSSKLKEAFAEVRHVKPNASRAESSEVYLLARGLRRPS